MPEPLRVINYTRSRTASRCLELGAGGYNDGGGGKTEKKGESYGVRHHEGTA
jgi:hypothetical protein